MSQLGIEVKTLTKGIAKWSFQRNGRGKRYGGAGFYAYTRIALNSNERSGGALKEVLAGNKTLKAEIGAQWIPTGAFEECGFTGGLSNPIVIWRDWKACFLLPLALKRRPNES